MTEEDLRKRGNDYIDKCTIRQGFVILPEAVRNDLVDMYVAGALDNSRWHYPSKGEVPNKNKIYVLADRSGEGDYDVMFYEHRKDEDVWGGKFTPPYMWQYIIPPQEEV